MIMNDIRDGSRVLLGSRRPRSVRAIAIAIAFVSGTMPNAWARDPDKPGSTSEKDRVGLVISGGVSEGAYQAGVTYALMKYLVLRRQFLEDPKHEGPSLPAVLAANRRAAENRAPGLNSDLPPQFEVAAGASAGNINSFLAALTWCAGHDRPLKPRENLFWDTWINVGWDKLSPVDPRSEAYKQLFADPLSTGEFRKLKVEDFGRWPDDQGRLAGKSWSDDQSVYTADDGLVTRAAFAAVQANLGQRLKDTDYRQACLVRVGLTATRARAAKIFLGQDNTAEVAADRYVVPLEVVTNGTAVVTNSAVNVDNVGLSLALPLKAANDPNLDFGSVVTLLKASSAFPIAFGPVPMAYCVPSPDTARDGSVLCPSGKYGTRTPFIDGGIFDNQPFGLAYALSTEEPSPTLFYVDTNPVRHPLAGRGELEPTNGIGLVKKIMSARVSEARGYENLAAATDQSRRIRAIAKASTSGKEPTERATNQTEAQGHVDPAKLIANEFEAVNQDMEVRPPQPSSRFFPIVGNRLVDSFGAFMHPSFRVHDYFVGVYDGLFTIAQALELSKDELKQPVSARRSPSRATFESLKQRIIDGDEDLNAFVSNLFEYERFWTGDAGAAIDGANRCKLTLDRPGPRDTWREDQNVAKVFETLCERDRDARKLERQGNVAELTKRLAVANDFEAVAQHVPELVGELGEWSFTTQDRVVRRAIDVERTAPSRNETSQAVEVGLLSSRYLAAASTERGWETLDLDPSSVERISGGTWSAGRLFWHVFPYYLAWDSVHGRVSLGWEPKLRFTRSFYATAGADLGLYTHSVGRPMDDGTPTKWELRTTLIGLGWDPKKRTVDDIQLALTRSGPLEHPTEWRSLGLELGAYPFGSKFRVSVGLPNVYNPNGRTSFDDAFSAWYFSVGLADLNGSLYWMGRSAAGLLFPNSICEEYCNGAVD